MLISQLNTSRDLRQEAIESCKDFLLKHKRGFIKCPADIVDSTKKDLEYLEKGNFPFFSYSAQKWIEA